MGKKTLNILLLIGFIIPMPLLFWPFAQWGDTMVLILRVVPALSVQALLYRVGKYNIIKAIPLIMTGLFSLWGTYLYFTSPHWVNATFGGMIADYVSPFISSAIVYGILALRHKS